ncbi:cytochrome P450 71A22 [Citrus sinensis]|nr:cytochrome P450 71A22 [Citrus sinensis]
MSVFQQLLNLQTLFTIAACIFAVFALFKWFLVQPISSKKSLPPSPPKLPIIGNLHQLGLFPHRSLGALAQRYGPLMLLHLGKVPVLVVSSADAACEIVRTHDVIFANRPKLTPFVKLLNGCIDVSMAPYDLSDILFTLTNNIVFRIALGRKYSDQGEVGSKFRKQFKDFIELMATFHVGDYIPWLGWICYFSGLNARLKKTAKEVDDFLEVVIQEHENRMSNNSQVEDRKDFIDVLLWLQKENILDFPIDKATIKALLQDVFGPGTDSTHTVLEWAMTELLRHPEMMEAVQNEVRRIVGQKSDITEEDLNDMHYLKAVIKETLRFHPPVPLLVPRQSTQQVKINGYDVAAGTQVYINYWAISRDPASWDQAEEFRPERFLNSSISFQGHDVQFIPFGAGRRGCPGTDFAMRMIELALASLLREFDWSFPDQEAKGQQRLDVPESNGLTIHRKFPLHALAIPR